MKYKIIRVGTTGELMEQVNELLVDGWQLVGVLVIVDKPGGCWYLRELIKITPIEPEPYATLFAHTGTLEISQS